jgi:FkbM family methyltransferase
MIFVSYAQNHEDVMLYRALREVERGFYIDVGAQDPVIDSVTKAFYERGWRGINIEPNAEFFRKLESDRPHDTNVCTAVGRERGTIAFHEVVNTGLSTVSSEYARRHGEAGYEVRVRDVPCTTLEQLCSEFGVNTVHFLKIDVEGSERAVLEGFSFERVRPWIVVIEATEPNSTREVFADWESLIVDNAYEFVYFDGLNRFYLAEEHADLKRHFSSPPNPFDQYVSYKLWRTNADLDELRAKERSALVNTINHMLAEVRRLQEQIHGQAVEAESLRKQLEGQIADARNQLEIQNRDAQNLRTQLAHATGSLTATQERLRSLKSSFSWRLTRPLREVRRAIVRIRALVIGNNESESISQEPPDQVALNLTEPARAIYRKLHSRS